MRFKVGDKVRVREDLKVGEKYSRQIFIRPMCGFRGKTVEIDDAWHSGGYNLKEDDENWLFTDEMLEPIADPLAQKVLERNNKHTGGLTDEKVNSPSHYNKGEIEVIDIIKQLTQGYEPFEAYLVGNTIKYLARANYKENKQQDLEKAEWHIDKLLEEEE